MNYDEAVLALANRIAGPNGMGLIVWARLDMEEGQWYSTITGGDPPEINLTGKTKQDKYIHIRTWKDIGACVRDLIGEDQP